MGCTAVTFAGLIVGPVCVGAIGISRHHGVEASTRVLMVQWIRSPTAVHAPWLHGCMAQYRRNVANDIRIAILYFVLASCLLSQLCIPFPPAPIMRVSRESYAVVCS